MSFILDSHFPNRKFAAFLFDFDGTIADTMGAHFDAWNKALAPHKITFTKEQHHGWAGRPTKQILRLLMDLHKVQINEDEFGRTKQSLYLASMSGVKEIAAVVDLVRKYHEKIPMAVVSGSRRRPVEQTLEHLKLSHYFHTLVCAEDYVNGKPDPECFLLAAKRLQVDPQECLVFEDASLGIQSAQRAGMACVRIIEVPNMGHRLEVVT